jgi:AcrR family transcriptional regulator
MKRTAVHLMSEETINPLELPVAGAPSERADAARNRARILQAADRLFTLDGVSCTSMDAIAAEAGVGKGTLFRRFGDRASLALALLDSSERELQEAFIRGPAPLGPGAPACERLIAFGRAVLAHTVAHGDLLLAGTRRKWDVGAYVAYRVHVTMLVAKAAPEIDAEYTAQALLEILGPESVLHQLRVQEMPLERLADGWETLIRRLFP